MRSGRYSQKLESMYQEVGCESGSGRYRSGSSFGRLDGITDAMNMNLGKFREMVRDTEAWRAAVHWVTTNRT